MNETHVSVWYSRSKALHRNYLCNTIENAVEYGQPFNEA